MSFIFYLITPIIAWRFSRGQVESSHKTSRILVILVVPFLLSVFLSGWLRNVFLVPEIHRWMGHAVVPLIGSFIAYSTGVAMTSESWRRPGIAFAKLLVLISLLAIIHLASLTGYLPIDDAGGASIDETGRRFFVLHQFLFPLISVGLVLLWYWLFRFPDDQKT